MIHQKPSLKIQLRPLKMKNFQESIIRQVFHSIMPIAIMITLTLSFNKLVKKIVVQLLCIDPEFWKPSDTEGSGAAFRIFSVGRYRVEARLAGDAAKLKSVMVIADTGTVPSLLATPI